MPMPICRDANAKIFKCPKGYLLTYLRFPQIYFGRWLKEIINNNLIVALFQAKHKEMQKNVETIEQIRD